ncbi:DNA helicase mcm9 [Orobanche gracilis]
MMVVKENDSGCREEMAKFLTKNHSEQLRNIILSSDPRLHYPLHVDFAELMDENPKLANLIFSHPTEYLPLFDESAIWVQEEIYEDFKKMENASVKAYVHVRINVSGSPLECPETFPSIGRVRVKHRGILLTLKGTVIRSGAVKMIEGEKIYECRVCKHRIKVYPEVESRNTVSRPTFCPSQNCESTRFQIVEDNKVCHDYQEIKIQESTQVLGVGAIPRSIPVILKDDLVDIVKAGDDVIVTGVLTARWSPDVKDVRCDLDPVLIANCVRRMNELKSDIDLPDDIIMKFKQFWSGFRDTPLKGRNAILRCICPQVFGLFTVKLAVLRFLFDLVALTLIGGVQHVDASGTKVRGESHLLLVGDPGTGKSQFLKFAAKLSNRSVITTGLGSTSAGLTVTAVKDGGEWVLEAGALVLADGGLCCIDEFDSFSVIFLSHSAKIPQCLFHEIMREHDRATIHEAMEQQTISVAKAGLVTSLSTRTIVFGATNPKGQYDPDQPLSVNTTLSGPLLSRFDIVLVLLDTKNPHWDSVVSSHILYEAQQSKGNHDENLSDIWSLTMLRRIDIEAENIISSYYQLQRRSATHNAAHARLICQTRKAAP